MRQVTGPAEAADFYGKLQGMFRSEAISARYGGGLDQMTRPKATDLKSETFGFAIALVVLLLI